VSTKFGLHLNIGSRNGYGEVVAAGPAVVLSMNDGGALAEAKQRGGQRVITIFRMHRDDVAFKDAPPNIDHMSEAEARNAADTYWPQMEAVYRSNPADFYQPVNETGGDNPTSLRNIIAFEMRLMELAERDGYKLAVGSPAGGSPGSWDLWLQFYLPLLRRAAQGGHIYSRHAYGGVESPQGDGLLTKPGPAPADANAGRPFREAEFLRQQGIVTPMIITEAGQNAGYQFPGVDVFVTDMARYDQLCQQHENIWGFCSWTYGDYQGFPVNIQPASQRMVEYLQQTGGAVLRSYPATAAAPPTADRAEAAGFQPSVDLGRVPAGSAFQATWSFLNSGSTTWDQRYALVYAENGHPETAAFPRSPMGPNRAFAIPDVGAPAQVRPGETVSLTVPLTAPQESGVQATNWQLRGPDGRLFGPVRWLRAVVAAEFRYELAGFQNSAGAATNLQPGQQFQAAWTVRNSGSGPWSSDFRLTYLTGNVTETAHDVTSAMGGQAGYTLQQLTGLDQVVAGQSVTLSLALVAPQSPGRYASHWQLRTAAGAAIGGPLWLRIGVAGAVVTPPAGRFQPGMNLNPDIHPLDLERLRGLAWVRFVIKAADVGRTVDQAFQNQYRALIQSYTNAGIRCLLILNHETEHGNTPWINGNWPAYAAPFGRSAGRIAELTASFGDMVAFQIWNEGDSGPENLSARGVKADDFAPALDAAAGAIKQANPRAKVVFGGLNTAPDNAVAYVRRVRERLNGRLPVDALAYHPYGRFVHTDPFYNQQFGTLKAAIEPFKQAFPNLPLWITEIGVADNNPIGPEHYAKIAGYMREFVNELADNQSDHVPVLIWFAWSDGMRNAGITTVGGQLKEHVGDAYREMVTRGQVGVPEAAPADAARATFLRFNTTLADHNAVPVGSSFTNQWVFSNSGQAAWDGSFRLVHAPEAGAPGIAHPLLGQNSFSLTEVAAPLPAAPGQEVAVSLNMTAPEQVGRQYVSRWELRDAAGVSFGHLYAEITTAPASTVGTSVHRPDMAFVADHTVDDDTTFREGEAFLKQWKVRNSGVRHWTGGFRLVFVEGDLQMAGGQASHVVPPAASGEVVILSVPMVAPPARNQQPTTYGSLWRMQDDRGTLFGEPIWVRIVSQPVGGASAMARFSDPAGWYSQLDSRWHGDQLGHGAQTIGSWGCLLTCQAMMLTAFGLPVDPAELNRRLKGMGAAAFNGSSVFFVAPGLLLPGLIQSSNLRSWHTPALSDTVWTGEDPLKRIDDALAAGHVVLAQVDQHPNSAYDYNSEQHWVILVARTPAGDDYLMLDPMCPPDQVVGQPRSLMNKYGNRIASRPHDENLRNAIQSSLVYRFTGTAPGG
jgi:hypothetical protein